jgi:hypothetical protein
MLLSLVGLVGHLSLSTRGWCCCGALAKALKVHALARSSQLCLQPAGVQFIYVATFSSYHLQNTALWRHSSVAWSRFGLQKKIYSI